MTPKQQIKTNPSKHYYRISPKGTIHNRAFADITLIDENRRLIPFIIVSADNAGLRYDWWEEEIYEERLDVNGATFDRLKTFFKDHELSVDTAIGKIENVRVDNGAIKCDVIFGTDEDSDTVYRKFKEGILSDVSIGYTIQEEITTERENQVTEVLITKFDIHELSAVWKGFDKNATIGRSAEDINSIKEVEDAKIEADLLKKKRLLKLDLAAKL